MAYVKYKYTKTMLMEAANNSYSIAEVMRKLGIRTGGGSYNLIKRRLVEFGIDASHFRGKGWNIERRLTGDPDRRTPEQILVYQHEHFKTEPTRFLRRALLEIGREPKCVLCGLGSEWNDRPLTLQIDHINGDKRDNRPENLQFLCPNCHSQTLTYNRPKKNAEVVERHTRMA